MPCRVEPSDIRIGVCSHAQFLKEIKNNVLMKIEDYSGVCVFCGIFLEDYSKTSLTRIVDTLIHESIHIALWHLFDSEEAKRLNYLLDDWRANLKVLKMLDEDKLIKLIKLINRRVGNNWKEYQTMRTIK